MMVISKTEEFIEKARKIHGDNYDYNKVDYVNQKTKIRILCLFHGYFTISPKSHLSGGRCHICAKESSQKIRSSTLSKFTNKASERHNNRYNYSKFVYVNAKTKGIIICDEHGEFSMVPNNHLSGQGCPKCKPKKLSERLSHTKEKFIELSENIHGKERYDYSRSVYSGMRSHLIIKCNICQNEFSQSPNSHIHSKTGCPECNMSKIENEVRKTLLLKKINFEKNKRVFEWLRNPKTNYQLELDFYLSDYNIAIECQGIQHFKPVKCFGGKETLKDIQFRDQVKKRLCEENGVKLYYVNYNDNVEEKMSEILNNHIFILK